MTATELRQRLMSIEPSTTDGGKRLYPCCAKLINGSVLPSTYFVSETDFQSLTGFPYPAAIEGCRWIEPSDVQFIEDSAMRLPGKFATQLYQAGESGMGYRVFTVVFSAWRKRTYVKALVDFIEYPRGKGPADVKSVLPHVGNRDGSAEPTTDIYWCVFDEPESGTDLPGSRPGYLHS